ncbi:peptidase M23 [Companilactobacillus sp. RD055328]|uniref:aggregation-promoting factor n=1 Tax=Companilactobacillus sp. RD055328 TaxID=2916634 RepID=UPI001FC8C54E|nr:LysM peptidoglycan-binding domain-containing protein [Companilactobacillus sp. RD055328]GKQ42981.1 peptidase M23 [Companilactobacillus sp. RD055328]
MKLRNLLATGMATATLVTTFVTASPVSAESVVNVTDTKNEKKTEVKLENGDNLWQLALDYDVDMEDIVKANDLDSISDIIKPDQELIIPGLQTDEAKARKENSAKVATPAATTTKATTAAPVAKTTPAVTQSVVSSTTGSENAAKEWIAQRESGGSYSARNGIYIGRYQLSSSYLNGDYSPANQERAAHNYVYSRYGSWQGAKSFWLSHGWY